MNRPEKARRLEKAQLAVAQFVNENESDLLFGLRTIGDRELAKELVEVLAEWRAATEDFLAALSNDESSGG